MKNKRVGGASLEVRRNRSGYVFITPFLIGFALFMLIPIVQSFYISFHDVEIVENGYKLIPKGIENFKFVVGVDIDYRMRLVESFVMTFRDTLVVIPFSFFSAIILSRKFPGRTLARTIFFLPVIVSVGVLAGTDGGNSVMAMMMGRDPTSASGSSAQMFSVYETVMTLFSNSIPPEMVSFVVKATDGIYDIIIKSGLQIIIFISALNSISPSLYEASSIEGATAWENFWKVTFPMCSPYILLNTVYTVIDSFTNISNPLIARVRGELIGLKAFGTASAAAWIYFFMIFITLGIVYAVIQRKVFYYE